MPTFTAAKPREDPLDYLPCSGVLDYPKDRVVYDQSQSPVCLYLVISGRIKVSRTADSGRQFMVDIYQLEELFGESMILNLSYSPERATAMEPARLMCWTREEIEKIILRRPRLAIALTQIMALRAREFADRLESFSTDNIQRRLAHALLRFANRMGMPDIGRSVYMPVLTHQLLAEYVGTSRELVSRYMGQFRRKELLCYSKRTRGIVLHPDACREWLRKSCP